MKRIFTFFLALCMTFGMVFTAAAKSLPAPTSTQAIADGWYNLRCMNNYFNVTSSGGAELRLLSQKAKYFVKWVADNNYTIKTTNDKYLGVSEDVKNGVQIKAIDKEYLWTFRLESGSDTFSLRPADAPDMILNASGEKNKNGTLIILWTYKNANAPKHAKFKFIPVGSTETKTPKATPDSSTEFSVGEASFSVNSSGTKITANLSQMKGVSKVLVTYILNGKETNLTTKLLPAKTKSTSLSVYVIKAVTEIRVYYYDMKGVKYATPKSYRVNPIKPKTEITIGEAKFSTLSSGKSVEIKLSGMKGVSKVIVKRIIDGREINYATKSLPSSATTKSTSFSVPVKTGMTEIRVYYYDMKGVKYATPKSYSVTPVVPVTPTPKPTPTPSLDMSIGQVAFAMNKSNDLVIVTLSNVKNVSKVYGYYVLNGKEVLDLQQSFKKAEIDVIQVIVNPKPGATEARIYFYDKNGVKDPTPKTYKIGSDATGKYYTPSGLTVLSDAFRSSVPGAIGEIVISENVKEIKGYAFYGSKSIHTFSLQNNPNFTVVDGVLFNKDMTTLIAYPQSKRGDTYTVPDSVVKIEDGAFGYNKYLKEIKFGANLKVIGVNAFRECNLTEVTIPEGVTDIYGCAFMNNINLAKITIPSSVTGITNDFLKGGSANLTIYGKPGSQAERFAKYYKYNFVSSASETLKLKGIALGDSSGTVDATAFRTINTSEGIWMLYGSYKDFLAVYFESDKAAFVYTNDITSYTNGVTVYTDKNDNKKKYAASIGLVPVDSEETTEQLVFEFTNAFRALNGLSALKWNDKLATSARAHSEDMKTRDFFDHINPDSKSPSDRITATGYDWMSVSENIFKTSQGIINAVTAVDGWVNSDGHRLNILTTKCDELGVGVVDGYATQNFGKQ